MSDISFLQRNDLVFFCGAGISLGSYIPGTQEILLETCKVFLPEELSKEEYDYISKNIQPEIFYEKLIQIVRNDYCFNLWASLNDSNFPNLNHLFIVRYSFLNRVPIITTNFDLMFERAAEILGVKYKVLLPDDHFDCCFDDVLYIFKVHGSLGVEENCIKNLSITMTSLTKINRRFIEYLHSIMNNKHLCIVGYSGRDLDLYPYIQEYAISGAKRIFWVNKFRNGSISLEKANKCFSEKISEYPEEVFRQHIQGCASNNDLFDVENYVKQRYQVPNERKLHTLYKELVGFNLINEQEKKLLYVTVLYSLARYKKAYDYAVNIFDEDFTSNLSTENKLIFYTQFAKLSHENTKYESCKKFSKIVMDIAINNGDNKYYDYYFMGMMLRDESFRMGIVKPVYFPYRKDFKSILYTFSTFISTIINFKMSLVKRNVLFSDLPSWIQHEYIEHQIRFYSVCQAALTLLERFSFLSCLRKSLERFLIREWDKLKILSIEYGYASGIANSGKYKNRLVYNIDNNTEIKGIFDLTSSSTGKEIIYRDDADRELKRKNIDRAEKFFRDSISLSIKSGNVLNSLKSYEGLLFIHQKHQDVITVQDKEIYHDLLTNVESDKLRNYYYDIYSNVLLKERYERK